MAPGARNKFAAPMFKVFRKQMYCFEKSALCHCWYFLASRSDLAPGELCPLAPLVTSLVLCDKTCKIFRK